MKTMDEACTDDYRQKRQMDDLRHRITGFLVDPPSRLLPRTRLALEQARDQLQKQADHVVGTWN